MVNCSSCGRETIDFTAFPCPQCGDSKLARCKPCKEKEIKYTCKKCNFQGP